MVSRFVQDPHGIRLSHFNFNRLHSAQTTVTRERIDGAGLFERSAVDEAFAIELE